MSVDFSALYAMGDAFRRGALTVKWVDDSIDPWALLDGRMQPASAVVFRHALGKTPMDLVTATHVAIDLISDRTYRLLREEAFTGWETYPVEIYGKRGESIDGYRGLRVTGRCGKLDNSRSQRVWRPPKVPEADPYQAWMGRFFDPESWDGSDFFLPPGTAHVFVVERVKISFEREKLTNFAFHRLTEIEQIMLV